MIIEFREIKHGESQSGNGTHSVSEGKGKGVGLTSVCQTTACLNLCVWSRMCVPVYMYCMWLKKFLLQYAIVVRSRSTEFYRFWSWTLFSTHCLSFNRYHLGTVRTNMGSFQKPANHILLNYCSCCITGQCNTPSGKLCSASPACMSSQMCMIGLWLTWKREHAIRPGIRRHRNLGLCSTPSTHLRTVYYTKCQF